MAAFPGGSSLRWDPYLLRKGIAASEFVQEYIQQLGNKDILYILGKGFDPRMCSGIEMILSVAGHGKRDCLLVEFDEGSNSPSQQHAPLVTQNLTRLNRLLENRGLLRTKQIQIWSDDGPRRRRVGSHNAADVLSGYQELSFYTDVIIDISSMPRSLYFPIIAKTLYLLDHAHGVSPPDNDPNLFVIVSEDAQLDRQIRDVSIDESASYIHGFGASLEMEATVDVPKVWMPILGGDQRGQLERIYTLVNPDEICPILPSPSSNPRRADELIIEYRELLFDQWRIEPRNIIYASEQNPFEEYRQICRAVRHYNRALHPLGGCKVVMSAGGSKLLSLGALLAAYELKEAGQYVGLAHVDALGYEIANQSNIGDQAEIFVLKLV